MIRRPPRSTRVRSSAASDVYKRQVCGDGLPPSWLASASCPPEHTLAPGIGNTGHKKTKKHEHFDNGFEADVRHNDCPRIHEQHFHIKGKKQQSNAVPARVKSRNRMHGGP